MVLECYGFAHDRLHQRDISICIDIVVLLEWMKQIDLYHLKCYKKWRQNCRWFCSTTDDWISNSVRTSCMRMYGRKSRRGERGITSTTCTVTSNANCPISDSALNFWVGGRRKCAFRTVWNNHTQLFWHLALHCNLQHNNNQLLFYWQKLYN